MKNSKKIALFVLTLAFFQVPAFAQFSVDWGTSNDTGNSGFTDLNSWFSANGYGSVNAQTDYIGYGAADSDPFSFGAGNYNFQIVQQVAGNADLTKFGFYTGTGIGKSLTESLAAGVTGPVNQTISQNFGLYMSAPVQWRSSTYATWFTDRAENDANQIGATQTNAGGDAQALIYKLSQSEWLVAWEDLNYANTSSGQSDHDYNDAYLKITLKPTVTPEPVSMALFGVGAGALGLKRLRRKKKTA